MDGRVEFVNNRQKWLIWNNVSFFVIRDLISKGLKNCSYQDFKTNMNIICHLIFRILYVAYGFFQFFATWAGFVKIFHHDNIIILLTSCILGFFPFIGTLSGLYGAHIGWGWSLSYSLFIFIVPYFIANGPMFLIVFYDIYKDSRRWKMEKEQSRLV